MGIIDIATRPLREGAGTAFKLGGWAFQQVRGGSSEQDGEQRSDQSGEQQQSPRPTRQSSRRPKQLDDVTIARKAETELFRLPGVEKGKIDVNVVDGKLFLRGTAKNPAQITALETAARAIPEVKDVENLLHQPKTPARKPKTKRNAKPRTEPRRLNADKTVKHTESLPETVAAEGKGRQPAPMGAEGGSEKSTAPTPADKGRFGREAGEGGGTPKRATTGVGTANGPKAGGGEVVN